MEYPEYLKTKHWLKLSKEVKKNAGDRCQLCNSTRKLQAHHRSYIWKGDYDKEIKDLICLCETCHANFHKTRKIKKLPQSKVNRIIISAKRSG